MSKPLPSRQDHAIATQELQRTADATIQMVGKLSDGTENESLGVAGDKLIKSLVRLKDAAEKLAKRPAFSTEEVNREAGIEEAKLLSAIEKWQRRYEAAQQESDTLERSVRGLEEEYGRLKEKHVLLTEELEQQQIKHERVLKLTQQASTRLDRALQTLERIDVEDNAA